MFCQQNMLTYLRRRKNSDIYHMGIILMELVTRRMPTGGTFGENVDMVRWVESHIEMQGTGRDELIDQKMEPLLPYEEIVAFQVLEIRNPMHQNHSC